MSIQNTNILDVTQLPPLQFSQSVFTSTPGFKSIGPSGASAVTSIHICNNNIDTIQFDLYVVEAGTAPIYPDNLVYSYIDVLPGETYVIDKERILLDSGDSIEVVGWYGAVPLTPLEQVTVTVTFIGI